VEGGEWKDCMVLDLSALGVGVSVNGAVPDELMGQWIVLEVQMPVGVSVHVRLQGEVRHAAHDLWGDTRVGVEFNGLPRSLTSSPDWLPPTS
jgi:hypothetical protein